MTFKGRKYSFIIHFLVYLLIITLVVLGKTSSLALLAPIIFILGTGGIIPIALIANGLNLLKYFFSFLDKYPVTLVVGLLALLYSKPLYNIKKYNKKSLWILLGFILFSMLSTSWTLSTNYGVFKVQGLIIGALIPTIAVTSMMDHQKENIKSVETIIVLLSIISTAVLIITNFNTVFDMRNTIPGINAIWNSRDIGIGIIILYTYISDDYVRVSKSKYLVIMLFLFVGLFINGSRGPIVSVVLTIGVMELLQISSKKLQKKSLFRNIFFIFSIVLGIILIVNSSGRFNISYLRTDKNISERLVFLSVVKDNLSLKPIIGNGIGSFSFLYRSNDFRIYPHNIILEIIIETGIIGLFLFIAIIVSSLRKSNNYNSLHYDVWLSVFVFYFIASLYSGDLFSNAFIFLPLAVLTNLDERST